MFRRLLTLCLCACLALQGASIALAREAPCPMETQMEAMVLAGELDPADLPGCCNDMQTWAKTGHLCQTGVDCLGFMAWALATVTMSVAAAPSTAPRVALSSCAPNAPPGAPWRPPTAG